MIVDLYTTKDVAKIREQLLTEQNNLCKITNLPLLPSDSVLDHDHKNELLVRGVISRQVNSFLGVIENAWDRYIKWWYSGNLPDLLRKVANYLEQKQTKYRHPSFQKKLQIEFNKLKEAEKDKVLNQFGYESGKNGADRKVIFKKLLLSKKYGYIEVLTAISKSKEKT